MFLDVAEVGQEIRRRCVPRRPDRSLVIAEPRHGDQGPFGPVQDTLIKLFVLRDALQRAVQRIGPGVVRAGEDRRVSLVVAADLHAPMAARIQEHMDFVLAVAAENDRLLAHAGREKVSGIRNQAFVSDEQPCPREQRFQLLLVDVGRNEDFTADDSFVNVNHRVVPFVPQRIHRVTHP